MLHVINQRSLAEVITSLTIQSKIIAILNTYFQRFFFYFDISVTTSFQICIVMNWNGSLL